MNISHSFSVKIAVLLGGAEMAIVLESLYDISLNNAQHIEMIADGNVWVKCSRSFLRGKFPYISDWRIRTILDKLVDGGYLMRGEYSEHSMDKSSWFTLTNKSISLLEGDAAPLVESTNALDGNAPFLREIAQKTENLREREKESDIKKETKEKKKEDKKIENSISKDIQKKEEKKEEIFYGKDGSLFDGKEPILHEEPTPIFDNHLQNKGANIAADLPKREEKFKNACYQFVGEFGTEMVDRFIEYWTEPTPSGRKMRFELERTWDTHRRMLTWARNNFGNVKYTPQSEHKDISAQEALKRAGWI